MIRKHESLIGNEYGKLKVVSLAYRKNSRIYWECVCECGETKYITTSNLTRKKSPTLSCGVCQRTETFRKLVGDKNPNWRGGRSVDDSGYVRIWSMGKYIREHRLVMSQMIGRDLLPEENVHHINGIKTDNRPENLELWSKSQPSGQRVEDKLKWAKEIIKLYDK